MSVYDDIKTSLEQAIAYERGKSIDEKSNENTFECVQESNEGSEQNEMCSKKHL